MFGFMEAQVIAFISGGVVVTARALLERFFLGCPVAGVQAVLWPVFRRFCLEPVLLPAGWGLEDIASLFDQLMDLVAAVAVVGSGGATFMVGEGAADV
jgi:hypothetical protein